METAKIFVNGGSQAVRLPKSCQFSCPEVGVQRIGSIVMLVDRRDALDNFLSMSPMDDDVFESIYEARKEDAAKPQREVAL